MLLKFIIDLIKLFLMRESPAEMGDLLWVTKWVFFVIVFCVFKKVKK